MQSSEFTGDQRESSSGQISPEHIIGALRKRAWLITALTLVCTILAGIFAYSLTPKYQASATVLIDPRKKNIIDMDAVVSGISADTPTIESEAEILRSRAIIGRVINELNLDQDPEFSGSGNRFKEILSNLGLASLFAGKPDSAEKIADKTSATAIVNDAIFVAVASRMTVSRRRNTFLIEVSFSSRSAQKAARIANAIVMAYLQDQVEAKLTTTEQATIWLEKRVQQLRERVYGAERRVEDFKARNNLIDVEGHSLQEKQLTRLMEQSVLARTKTASSRARYEQAVRALKSGGALANNSDVLKSHTITLLRNKLAEITRKAAELRTRYGPKHPVMKKILAEVGDARRQLNDEIARIIANYQNEFKIAKDREATLDASLKKVRNKTIQSKEAAVRLRELEREAKASRTVYEAFLKRYQETAEQKNLQVADARVVERAIPPQFPASPKKKRIVALGLAGGLALGIALAILLDLLSPGPVRPEQIEARYRLEHLASLSAAFDRPEEERDRLRELRLILAEPQSNFAEAIRTLRLAIDGKRRQGAGGVVLIASALPNEGKTQIASNLAHYYALTGTKTALVDGDLRQSPLTRQLLPDCAHGLATPLLSGDAALPHVMADAVTDLNFLPAGPAQSPVAGKAAELLASERFGDVVNELRAAFDMVVIDAPPILPVVDARIIADHADLIIYVMQWNKTPPALVKRAIRALSQNEHKFAGIVVSGAESEGFEYLSAYPPAGTPEPARAPAKEVVVRG